MKLHRGMRGWVFLITAICAGAPAGAPAGAQVHDGYVEAGSAFYHLSADFGNVEHRYLRSAIRSDPANLWTGEVSLQRGFGDRGVFYGLTNTHVITPAWYSIVSAGSSSGGFFLPRFRGGVTVARKWLPGRLVTTLGAGYFGWKDGHRDVQLSAGAIYYFRAPLVIESGVTWNRSSPGNVLSRYQYVAATHGRDRHRYLTARIAGGRESYQLLSPGEPIVDFRSNDFSLGVRQWITPNWGFSATAESYWNPSYTRRGATLGVFLQLE